MSEEARDRYNAGRSGTDRTGTIEPRRTECEAQPFMNLPLTLQLSRFASPTYRQFVSYTVPHQSSQYLRSSVMHVH